MLVTKQFALRHRGMRESNKALLLPAPNKRPGSRFGSILFCTAFLASLGPPARAQGLPLPVNEQAAVNWAIDQGVDYLKSTQGKHGTWAKLNMPHPVGYAALPGLTLLECGIAPTDPLIQRTARYLRSHAARLDATYELSLAILFLDRLGDPKDKKIIQTFALRLIAGQSATGGWGYKCPVLGSRPQLELLTALRHLDPPLREGMPGIVGAPNKLPGIAGGPAQKPGDLTPITQTPGANPLRGTTTAPATPPLSGTTTDSSSGSSLPPQESTSGSPSQSHDPLGFLPLDDKKLPPDSPDHLEKAPKKKDAGEPSAKPEGKDSKPATKPAKPYVIPERIQMFAVVQNPALHVLRDPLGKSRQLFLTTTDNSNTQFAILALWAAQRYDVPMNRTLNLIVRRYATSQRADGAWTYRYRFGGGPRASAPMTCVGLIGLAVGHGIAKTDERPAGQPVRDPRIINGLIALSQYVGKPADRMANLPMQNLYFLWSLERAAVLYGLPMIGDKDWYRWGAQILIANQDSGGNWVNGQYPGSSPTIDTCLALLFLKRANLVKDLTARLPFKPAELHDSVMEKLAPPAPQTPPEPIKKTPPPIEPPKRAEPDNLISKPLGEQSSTSVITPVAAPESVSPDEEGGNKKWVVLFFVLFVLLAGSSLFFLLAARRKEDEEENVKSPKKRRSGR